MELLPIIGFLLIGVLLIVVEVIFIPGTTVVGIAGFVLIVFGLYWSFSHENILVSIFMTTGVVIILGFSSWYALKKQVWKRYSLQTEISGKVDNDTHANLKEGDEGVTISALRPLGTAEFGDIRVEVSSLGSFVDSGERVRIFSKNKSRIIVETV